MDATANVYPGSNVARTTTTNARIMQTAQPAKAATMDCVAPVSAHRFSNPFAVLMVIPMAMSARPIVPRLPSLAKALAHHRTAMMPANVSMAHGVKPRTVLSVGQALCPFVLRSIILFPKNAALRVRMPMAMISAMRPTHCVIWTMCN